MAKQKEAKKTICHFCRSALFQCFLRYYSNLKNTVNINMISAKKIYIDRVPYFYPLQAKRVREVANLTERKNQHTVLLDEQLFT